MIGNILDNTTELYMIKYTFGEILSSGGATLPKNPSDQAVFSLLLLGWFISLLVKTTRFYQKTFG